MPNFNSLEKIKPPVTKKKTETSGDDSLGEYDFSEDIEAGHKAADEINEERRLAALSAAEDHEEREKCREEDREDLEKTYKRF
jgi:hypothetical protein